MKRPFIGIGYSTEQNHQFTYKSTKDIDDYIDLEVAEVQYVTRDIKIIKHNFIIAKELPICNCDIDVNIAKYNPYLCLAHYPIERDVSIYRKCNFPYMGRW